MNSSIVLVQANDNFSTFFLIFILPEGFPVRTRPPGKDGFWLLLDVDVDALFRYSHERGLARRRLTTEALFDPFTLAPVES